MLARSGSIKRPGFAKNEDSSSGNTNFFMQHWLRKLEVHDTANNWLVSSLSLSKYYAKMLTLNTILDEIKDVPVSRLEELYQFVHSLTLNTKKNETLRKKILSFGGSFWWYEYQKLRWLS